MCVFEFGGRRLVLQFAIGETYPSALVFTFLPFEVLPPHFLDSLIGVMLSLSCMLVKSSIHSYPCFKTEGKISQTRSHTCLNSLHSILLESFTIYLLCSSPQPTLLPPPSKNLALSIALNVQTGLETPEIFILMKLRLGPFYV